MVFIFSGSVSAQSLTRQGMIEFYPNNIGNSWSYRWIYYDIINNYYEGGTDENFISKDTLINNTKYWSVEHNYGGYNYENYFERIDTATGDVLRSEDLSAGETNLVDNVYAGIGDTILISNNRYLLYCDKIVVLSIRDTILNNFQTTLREVVGLPSLKKLFLAKNIGLLGSGPNYWIDSAKINGIIFSNISSDFTDINEDNESIGNNYILFQNYPNPFNPTTNISYSISEPSYVSIIIYDLLGREVSKLVNEFKSTGIYTIGFDSSKLSSGIYFYQMKVNDFVNTKKMILLR
jgi:hypothetical protein